MAVSSVVSTLRVLTRSAGSLGAALNNSQGSWHVTRGFHLSDALQGGRPKSVWRKRRHPANTRLNHELPEKIKERKAFGGHHKLKALRVNKGLYTWQSYDIELETPVIRVVHSYANKDHITKQVMVKGSIVQVDSSPFRSWYQECKDKRVEGNQVHVHDSETRTSLADLEKDDLLYAKITTRPGQVGACNGYILEGEELETLITNLGLGPVPKETGTAS